MSKETRASQGHQLEVFIGNTLRIGVISAALVSLTGGILFLLQHARQPIPDYSTFTSTSAIHSLKHVLAGVAALDSIAVIQLGILLLLATPIARLLFSLTGFALQRDWLYVCISLVVLGIIAWSVFSGVKG